VTDGAITLQLFVYSELAAKRAQSCLNGLSSLHPRYPALTSVDHPSEKHHLRDELHRLREDLARARAQNEATAYAEARYAALLEASADVVWSTDAEGMVEDMPQWRDLTGQTKEEVKGAGWLDAVHPEDKDRTRDIWWQAHTNRTMYKADYRLRMADGTYRWQRARGVQILDEEGNVREWIGTLSDIEEERRVIAEREDETRLVETLREISRVLAADLSLERIVQTVTDTTTALSGAEFGAFFYNIIDKAGEKYTLYTLSGAPREAFEDFGHPRATPVFAPTFYGTAIVRSDDITQDPRYGQMAPHHGMPPGHLPVRSYLAVPVISRNGEILGGLFFGHSQTGVFTARVERLVTGVAASASVAIDNARLYEAEQRARSSAEAANAAKSAFLANMSHELRTPLNAIGGYADLITEGIRGPVTDAQRADLARIKRSQQHLLSIINDILNFAKLEAGRVDFVYEDVSMSKALGELETLIAPQLLEKQLKYRFDCCDDSYTAYADSEKLQQIMLNLLSNALKFTPRGGSITLVCKPAADFMMVDVVDTGTGIPKEKLAAIFEPFIQVDRSLTGHIGTGLGLAISRDLARAMRGDLVVESKVGKGSRFTLSLPRRKAETA
jgi:PAS domain S-box-containing protein